MDSHIEHLLERIENRQGFVYYFAYGWIVKKRRDHIHQTNVCRLFWRLLFSIPVWPLWAVFQVFLLFIYGVVLFIISVFFVIGFFFGCKPTILNRDDSINDAFVNYEHWPVSIKGYRILPIYAIIAGPVLWALYRYDAWFLPTVSWTWSAVTDEPSMFFLGFLIIAFILFHLTRGLWKSDVGVFVRNYFKEWKGKHCRLIRFKEKETKN